MPWSITRRRLIAGTGAVAASGTAAWVGLRDGSGPEASGASVPTVTTSVVPSVGPSSTTEPPAEADRVLVVLQLGGGNDGLNTLVPHDGRYRDARSSLAIAESDLLSLGDGVPYGLHPALEPLLPYWNDGSLVAVQGLGFADQSRSHFEATDYWWAARSGSGATTGWLGRWIDEAVDEPNPLTAVAFGSGAPALLGEHTVSTLVRSPDRFQLFAPRGSDRTIMVNAFLGMGQPVSTDPALAAAQLSIGPAVEAVEALTAATDGAMAGIGTALGASSAGAGLQAAAGVIEQNPTNRVIVVGVGGYDTHANQLDTHAGLLADMAQGLVAFFDRLERSGHAERVMVMTTSEFGRRVSGNGSNGTDHGAGGLALMIGPAVAGGRVVGELDLVHLDQGDVPITVDTRSYYAAGLSWLGGPVEDVLDGATDDLGLLAT